MTRLAPPGRSGRLILRRRLVTSGRAGDLLSQKEEALRRERERLSGQVVRTRTVWEHSCAEMDAAVARVRLLGGATELRAMTVARADEATVTCRWQTAMGVEYPGDVTVEPGPVPRSVSTAAFGPATLACRTALAAGAEHAAAAYMDSPLVAALVADAVFPLTPGTDLARRRRAVVDRLVPQLTRELHQVEIDLDEAEREEALRTRLAVARRDEET